MPFDDGLIRKRRRMKHSVRSLMIIAVATLVIDCPAALGDVYTVNNSTSGAEQYLGFPDALSLSFSGYFVGFSLGESHPFLNFFSFDLSGVTGNVVTATFN